MINKLRQLMVEYYLNHLSHRPYQQNLDWQIHNSEFKDITIRWTNKYQWDEAEDWVNLLLYGFRKFVKVE